MPNIIQEQLLLMRARFLAHERRKLSIYEHIIQLINQVMWIQQVNNNYLLQFSHSGEQVLTSLSTGEKKRIAIWK